LKIRKNLLLHISIPTGESDRENVKAQLMHRQRLKTGKSKAAAENKS